jgi:signal transduction histidine kinase
VRVTYEDATLEVDVADDGHGVSAVGGSGHGLIGMRERVRLHGGHLRAGPDPAGGFVVHASFPLNGGGA